MRRMTRLIPGHYDVLDSLGPARGGGGGRGGSRRPDRGRGGRRRWLTVGRWTGCRDVISRPLIEGVVAARRARRRWCRRCPRVLLVTKITTTAARRFLVVPDRAATTDSDDAGGRRLATDAQHLARVAFAIAVRVVACVTSSYLIAFLGVVEFQPCRQVILPDLVVEIVRI